MDTHPLWRPFSADSNATRQSQRVAFRQVEPGPLREYDSRWADAFGRVRTALVAALGPGTAITHVGSTAVPGMIAKPVIDVDVLVTDVLDEASWLPKLEEIGFRLVFRDVIAGDPHCQLTLGDPNTNLHVWRPDAAEPRRHRLFVSWLQRHPEDRRRYADAKAEAVRAAADGLRYNDAKAAVVYDLYERVFAADPDHPHAPPATPVITPDQPPLLENSRQEDRSRRQLASRGPTARHRSGRREPLDRGRSATETAGRSRLRH